MKNISKEDERNLTILGGDVYLRRELVLDMEMKLTDGQVKLLLADDDYAVRARLVGRKDIKLTEHQINDVLKNDCFDVQLELVKNRSIQLNDAQVRSVLFAPQSRAHASVMHHVIERLEKYTEKQLTRGIYSDEVLIVMTWLERPDFKTNEQNMAMLKSHPSVKVKDMAEKVGIRLEAEKLKSIHCVSSLVLKKPNTL